MRTLEFNPVLVKELRTRMRGARAFVILSVYLGILSAVTILLYSAVVSTVGDSLETGRQIGKTLFLVIGAVALTEVCIITPSLTAGSIVGEKERQTYDLLIASQLTPWQIVWGKLAAALSFAFLLVLSVVPLMSLAFLFGGVSLAEVIIALVGMVATAVLYASLGLFWSTTMRSSLGANSLALGTVTLLLLGIPFLSIVGSLILQTSLRSLENSVAFLYVSGLVLSLHPFIALGLTELLLSEGRNPFFTFFDFADGSQVLIPSPWLVYVMLAVVLSALFISASMRSLHPDADQPGPAPRRTTNSEAS